MSGISGLQCSWIPKAAPSEVRFTHKASGLVRFNTVGSPCPSESLGSRICYQKLSNQGCAGLRMPVTFRAAGQSRAGGAPGELRSTLCCAHSVSFPGLLK